LVLQYRPAVSNLCLEFPAGLVDEEDTSVESAALREVQEECGYIGGIVSSSVPLAYEPGITSANMRFVHINIDGDLPQNKNPQQQLGEEEYIETILVDSDNLLGSINDIVKERNCIVDSKLYTFAYGTSFSKNSS